MRDANAVLQQAIKKDFSLFQAESKAFWAVTIILSGGTTIMMAGGEESKAA